ncbi:uncharacterized protein LOC106662508 [Cimex lectularius]|uniref:Uncharacterized protein n=1 Tax=Cimex lectularius TaxID=79782 RepID=A0A8I6RBI3_CIMLE|nr:uncharacterized protein LOC106662508 [Cimex lectularius]
MKRLEERIPNLNDRLYPKNNPKKRYVSEDLPSYKLNLSKKKNIFGINNPYCNPIINQIKLGSNEEVKPHSQSSVIKKRPNKKLSCSPVSQILSVQLPAKTTCKEKHDHIPQHMTVEDPIDDCKPKTENQLENKENMSNAQKDNIKYPFIQWNFNKAESQMKKDTTEASIAQNSGNSYVQEVTPMELDETKQVTNDKLIQEGNETIPDIKHNQGERPIEMNSEPSISQLHENNDNKLTETIKLEKTRENRTRENEIVNECVTIEDREDSQKSQNEQNINTEDYLDKICTQYVTDLPQGQKGTLSNNGLIELMLLQLNSKPVVFINKLNQDKHLSSPAKDTISSPKNSLPQSPEIDNKKKNTKECRVSFAGQSSLKRKSPNDQDRLTDDSAKKPLVSILKNSNRERMFYSKQSLCTPKVNVTRLDLNELLRLSVHSSNGPINNIGDVYNTLKESQSGNNETVQRLQSIQEQTEKSRLDLDLESSSLPVDKYKKFLSQTSSTDRVDNCERRGLVEMCYYKDNNVAGKRNKITFDTFQPSTSTTNSEKVHKTLDDSSNQIPVRKDGNQSVEDMMPLLNTDIWRDFMAHVSGRSRCASGVLKTSPLFQRNIDHDTQLQTSPTKFPSPLRNVSIDLDEPASVKNSSSDIGDNFNDVLRLNTPQEIVIAQKELSMDYSPVCSMNENISSNLSNPFLGSDQNPLMHLDSFLKSQTNENMQQLLEDEMKRKSILAQLLEVCKLDSHINTTLQYGSESSGSNLQNPLVNIWDDLECVNIKSEPQFDTSFESDDE